MSIYNARATSATTPMILYLKIIRTNMRSVPMTPASTQFLAAFMPRLGPTISVCTSVSPTGSAPPLMRAARFVASSAVKLPVIWQFALFITVFT